MAKKSFDISGIMDDFDSDISQSNSKKKGRVVSNNATQTSEPTGKEFGTRWRKNERPIQKCIHVDADLSAKIDLLKSLMNAEGKKVTVEDIIYEATKEYVVRELEKEKEKLSKIL